MGRVDDVESISDQGVGDGQDFPRQGDEGDLFLFALGEQLVVEVCKTASAAGGGEGGHIEGLSNMRSTAGHEPLAGPFAAVSSEGGQADQGGNLFSVEGSEFGQSTQKGARDDVSDPLDALERLLFEQHGGIGVNETVDLVIEVGDLLGDPVDALLDHGLNGGRCDSQAVFLGGVHVDELLPACDQSVQGSRLLVRELRERWVQIASETCEHLGIDTIGLCPFADGFCEIASLARVDDTQGDLGGTESAGQFEMKASGGFENDADIAQRFETGDQLGDGRGLVQAGENFPFGAQSDHEGILGDIDADFETETRHGKTLFTAMDNSTRGAHPCGYGDLRA